MVAADGDLNAVGILLLGENFSDILVVRDYFAAVIVNVIVFDDD